MLRRAVGLGAPRGCLAALLALGLAACRPGGPAAPAEPVVLRFAYGSELRSWADEELFRFSAAAHTRSGRPIKVVGEPMGSGEGVQRILAGTLQPHVFCPASSAFVSLLNEGWLAQAGHRTAVATRGEPLVFSPVVIALWRPMAEVLGWPGRSLGWSDLLRVAADPAGWAAHGHPEWGRFRLGHTHPESSNSGLLSVLAEASAGAGRRRLLEERDLDSPATQQFLSRVEATMVHYGKSTGFFADKLVARGPGALSAAVLYENLVVEANQKLAAAGGTPLVAVYPSEGTFWSDHPYATLDAPWTGPEEKEAAALLFAWLRSRPVQQRALQLGFRPADLGVPLGAPVDAAHGVDPDQPLRSLDLPSAGVLRKLVAVWKQIKRSADVTLIIDKSASMTGQPLQQAKAGARAFLGMLDDRDSATVLFFDSQIYPAVGPLPLAEGRADLLARIEGVGADGGSTLYQSIDQALDTARRRAKSDPSRIHALVVMADGVDTESRLSLPELQARLGRGDGAVGVFVIAYGSRADREVLSLIADAARGSFVTGNVQDLIALHQDLARFF